MGMDEENPKVEQSEEGEEKSDDKKIEDPCENELQNTIGNAMEEPIEQKEAANEEESVEKNANKLSKRYKKVAAGAIIGIGAIAVLYFAMSAYFIKHFYFGTEINGISVSGKSVKDVEALMDAKLQDYSLTIKERGGKSEQIKASDVGLKFASVEEFSKLKDKQKPFNWLFGFINKEESKMTVEVKYDEKLLKERIDKLSCFNSSNIIEPKNPTFKYVDNSYVIVDEILGNKVDKEILIPNLAKALLKSDAELDLESIGCYIKPEYNSKSSKIIEVKDILNKYAASKITYNFGSKKEVLDGTTINKWLSVDEKFAVVIDDKQVKDYVAALAQKYDTTGRTREFITSSGTTVQVGGGDFGRSINKAKEAENLISAIKQGGSITKEAAYSQTVFSNGSSDIGNTYVEIDLTKQHIWFYKNGSLVVEGDIVTGNVSTGHTTPKGVYSLKYKAKDVVLRGPGYAAPVTFWMPFNGGIGMHDASWRSVFGGTIYKTDGSHGCINCPYSVVQAIYNNIQVGTPVICY